MIKPPFTVLILKESRHPVTVRVTSGLIVLFLLSLIISGMLLGFSLSYLVALYNGQKPFISEKGNTPEYTPLQTVVSEEKLDPDINSISIKRLSESETDITVRFSSLPENEEVYVWLIVNPETEIPGERIVHPRNPLFRGFPADYRNGMAFFPSEDQDFTISLADEIEGISLRVIRILVYSAKGDIIADRSFREPNAM